MIVRLSSRKLYFYYNYFILFVNFSLFMRGDMTLVIH